MADQIVEGDTVRMKSGGPLMTVASISGENANCEWFDNKDQAQFKQFRLSSIVKDDGAISIG